MTTAWLSGGLALARLPGAPRRAAAWAAELLAASHTLPVLALVADVGALLHGEPLLLGAPPPPVARRATLAYEDQLLGRLASERLLVRASDATLRLPPRLRARAVAHVCAALLARLGTPARVVPPALARAFLADPRPDPSSVGSCLEELEALAAAARGAGVLLHEADVAVLEQPVFLESAAQRLAARQVLEAADELEATLPRRHRRRRRVGSRPATGEGAWPAGGLASIAPGSSLENLVPSELVYMEPGAALDLFAMRWAEGDLLTYVRDETLTHAAHETVVFVLGPELAAERFRHEGERWQRLVLVLGALVCAARRLQEPATRVELCFVDGGRLDPERDLCRLLDPRWRVTRAGDAPEGGIRVTADPRSVLDVAA